MTSHAARSLTALICLASCLLGCQSKPRTAHINQPWHDSITDQDASNKQVTVVIALSSIVPGGVIGHAGIAVDDAYWDYGPKRHKYLQPIQSVRSPAGPWWDDPDQQWANDRTLTQVLDDMPDKVHPLGSLVAVIQVQVTDTQAQAITTFWQDTYARMRADEDTYRLTARQCASMVGWSLDVALQGGHQSSGRLPRDLHLMSPTGLYQSLSESLAHTAGPSQGQPANITLWQLGADGFELWQRAERYDQLALPRLPRVRLAYERFKYLPADLTH